MLMKQYSVMLSVTQTLKSFSIFFSLVTDYIMFFEVA